AIKITEKAAHLTSLGTMAAGISHEINQPLTALKIRVDSMLYWKDSDKFLEKEFDKKMFQDHLEFVSEQTSRIDNIVRQIRSLAVKDRDSRTVLFNVNKVIKDALAMMKQQMSARGIKVNLNLEKSNPNIEGQITSLQQVIINLVSNARDALQLSKRKRKEIDIQTEKDNDTIRIVVRDNGPGIDSENIDRLFEPFFTTKGVEEGMGLGLSIVQSSVNAMGGSINVRNNDKGGACFTILLPIAK
ncbi:ATP-binding protein, partial [candidate division KSB1 bacterium]|nr:ATP-binding protein [candidate division KSB1 bacterium]